MSEIPIFLYYKKNFRAISVNFFPLIICLKLIYSNYQVVSSSGVCLDETLHLQFEE